jgi:hypothetical protein
LFLIGNLVAFIVAIIAIKFFIEIIKNTVSSPGDGTELLLVHFINLLYIFKIILFEDSRRFPKRTNLIDKPLKWSSFQAVNKLKYTDKQLRTSQKFKIGHAGTLDPLATGLLLVCTGNSQRELQTSRSAKEYRHFFL